MAYKSMGVFPCTKVVPTFDFTGDGTAWTSVSDLTSVQISIDTEIQTYYALNDGGVQSALATAKAVKYTFNGKRNVNDDGNNKIAGMAFKIGSEAAANLKLTFPNGATIEQEVVVAVSELGGDSTAISQLNFTCTGNGTVKTTAGA